MRRLPVRAVPLALATLVAVLGAGCSHQPPQPRHAESPPPSLTAPYAASASAGESVYRLDSDESAVWVLVDKTGPLAAAGHRHVITAGKLHGFALVHSTTSAHGQVRFPVAALSVDPPAAMARFHVDEKFSAEDRAGTRRHMLGASVLDARVYPQVWLKVRLADARPGKDRPLHVTVHLHGVTRTFDTDALLVHGPDESGWRISGQFALKQTAFGITPYSVALGALRVKNAIHIHYRLTFVPWHRLVSCRCQGRGEAPPHGLSHSR